jgi:signal transduction histidine kinase
MLGGISNGTTRLRDIINDMIDVSLIDMKILELHMQPVWLSRLVSIVVSELEPSAQARMLSIVVDDFEDGDKPILGDAERLHQVFRNVIANAIKFTPDGGTIAISSRSLPQFFDVQVADTGIGIDADDLDRIFDKFAPIGDVSLHSSSKTKFKGGGPGLGLAIARGIIEAHGGNIWAESLGYDEERCPGSTFHIMVPVRPVGEAEDASENMDAMKELFDATQEKID